MKTSTLNSFIFNKPFFIVAACLAFQSARATLLFEDGFNYTAGALNATAVSPAGLSGNAWSSGSSHITVTSGNLTYAGLKDLGGNQVQDVWGVGAGSVINTFSSVTSGQIYYSFLVNITTAPSADSYLTALNPGTTAPGGSADAINMYVNASDQIRLRTSGKSEVTAATLSLNTTYLVVLEYNFATATASLYLNPTAGAVQPAANATITGGIVTSIADVGFKAQNTPTTGTFLLDNLMIGTTWADVTPTPEPSTLALAGLGAVGLLARFRQGRR